jgi:hypothetical protein
MDLGRCFAVRVHRQYWDRPDASISQGLRIDPRLLMSKLLDSEHMAKIVTMAARTFEK